MLLLMSILRICVPHFLSLGVVLLGACTTESIPKEDIETPDFDDQTTDGIDFENILSDHNNARSLVSSPPLKWNNNLAASSQQWANGCLIGHDPQRDFEGTVFGENIAAGTFGFSVENLGKLWIDEEIDFWNCQNNTCSQEPCGHYTQIIWKNTEEIGCAASVCGNQNFLVCRYLPAGNVRGERPVSVSDCQN